MKKIFSLIIMMLLLCGMQVNAKCISSSFKKTIRDARISQNSIAISIKNVDTGRNVYQINEKILMHPASIQKVLTIIPIMEALGSDYNFETKLYSRGDNGYLIKLGADPYLTTSDLETIVNNIKSDKVKQIYIDNTIIEPKDWGEGWQWDDDLNEYMPRFNSYNLDGNTVKITIMPTDTNKQAFIINPQKSPMIFYNNVITSDKNNIRISRDNITSANTLKLEGTIHTPETHIITNNNLKRYFEKKLTDILEDKRIYLKSAYITTGLNSADKSIIEVSHPVSKAVEDVLLNSNNMVIETMSKLAAGKQYNKQGTDVDGVKLFNDYCEKNQIDNSGIRIVDASGVSKNNLINTEFIANFLVKNKDNAILENMASPGQGTLSERMLPLKDNLKAKTGTLSDISSIAGYITAKSGQKYAFCIMINDPASQNAQKKSLENHLIRDMYLKL